MANNSKTEFDKLFKLCVEANANFRPENSQELSAAISNINVNKYVKAVESNLKNSGEMSTTFDWKINKEACNDLLSTLISNSVPKDIYVENDVMQFREVFRRTPQSAQTKPVLTSSTSNLSQNENKSNTRRNENKKSKTESNQSGFQSAKKLYISDMKKKGKVPEFETAESSSTFKRTPSQSKFVSPLLNKNENNIKNDENQDERLKNIDPKMIELIKSEIMDVGTKTTWSDIAGLEQVKATMREAVVLPMLRPDIFTGLRRPPKGILLFGPPGTGKTLIGKCVASQSKSTFFCISASSLTSKWIGDGEKMVRALFTVARCHQPAVIFIDEVDSLLSQRSDQEHECSRRMKTEFLVQLDGATTEGEERILVIGATNRPQELDEAARRRFIKRLYVPLPEFDARLQLIKLLMQNESHTLTDKEFEHVANLSKGYSCADVQTLCCEAAMSPLRNISFSEIEGITASDVPRITFEDFQQALITVRSSVAPGDLEQYVTWNNTYGFGKGC